MPTSPRIDRISVATSGSLVSHNQAGPTSEPLVATPAVRIGLASPEDVLRWSSGEVTRSETLNYRSLRPERGGLFCERIFGPDRDYECACGTYRGVRHKGFTCAKCGVQVAHSRVRRKRMGHIDLAAPVVHCWFFRGTPNRLAALLGLKRSSLDRVIYYQDYIVVDAGRTSLEAGTLLSEAELREAYREHGDRFEALTGAAAVEALLRALDVDALAGQLRQELRVNDARPKPSASRRQQLLARLQTVELIQGSGNRPEWMVLHRLPVIPPDLRPIVQMQGGTLASSDLNDLYRRILTRNNRLKKLREMDAPAIILRAEMRMLQQAVDALFDNARSDRPALGPGQRPLKSLTDMLAGKKGRFRENLLGKRVDYSGRSVIVVGPELKLHQCGLPKKIALELFHPFLIRRMRETGLAATHKRAAALIKERDERIWDLLEAVMLGHPVLLNRAPTLHRMGIQAFEPLLIDGSAIRLHPLVCKAFNADFDGDQMAVHLPLSVEAQVEARVLMMPTSNILSPASGQPILGPTQDVVLGCYYLTVTEREARSAKRVGAFHNTGEVVLAHSLGKLGLHDRIRVRLPYIRTVVRDDVDDSTTTVGRVLFNDVLPVGMPFYDLPMTSANLARVISDCHARLGRKATVELLDRVKALGFRYATASGVSIGIADLKAPPGKAKLVRAAEKAAEKVRTGYRKGDLTALERAERIVKLWTDARDRITDDLMEEMARDEQLNPVLLMAQSGARGGREQLRQLAGMRGLIARPSGEVVETPITSSFREGLTVHEYFSSTHGARKGLADTALKTAEAGHLTRKLVDAAQNVVVTMHDCGTEDGILKRAVVRGEEVEQTLAEAVRGRVCCAAGGGAMLTDEAARGLAEHVHQVRVRSPLTCQAARGVCRLCYGMDLSTGALVEVGTAIGVIAGQSIGEPGTQLTMRTFHIGGVHSKEDITLGLPRVIELFEARRPKVGPAPEDILARSGREAVADYLLREVQAVYRAQSVRLDDKHVEVILARMLSKVRIVYPGDTSLMSGAVLSRQAFEAANAALQGGEPATAKPVLQGIARAAVQSDSFISAASFQETTRVLTAAALAGKVDPLAGLKENVIVGRLVPAGTGFRG